jgi:LysM repeat protein
MGMSLWQRCTVVLLGIGIFGGAGYFAHIVSQPPELERYKSIPWVSYVHPNVKKLKEAQDLVGKGRLNEGHDVVVNALVTAPKSPVTRELRDLLGNINTQIFFSKEPSPRKAEYIVKPGDTLSSIARKLDSSAEAIARVNGLDSTLIRPGETLFVPRLDFKIIIDVPSNRVIVHDTLGFFCQYPIAATNLPTWRSRAIQTKVEAESFWKNGQPVRADRFHKEGTPRIEFGRKAFVLYGIEQEKYASISEMPVQANEKEQKLNSPDANRSPKGIGMLKEDIAEMELLIRKGTPVTIILNQQQKEDRNGSS